MTAVYSVSTLAEHWGCGLILSFGRSAILRQP